MSTPLAAQSAPGSVGLAALLLTLGARPDELDAIAAVLKADYGNPANLQDVAVQGRAAILRCRAGRETIEQAPPFDPDR